MCVVFGVSHSNGSLFPGSKLDFLPECVCMGLLLHCLLWLTKCQHVCVINHNCSVKANFLGIVHFAVSFSTYSIHNLNPISSRKDSLYMISLSSPKS